MGIRPLTLTPFKKITQPANAFRMEEQAFSTVDAILNAHSQEEVKSYVDNMIRSILQRTQNDQEISVFSENVMNRLQMFSPFQISSREWSNIKLAGILFNRVRQRYLVV